MKQRVLLAGFALWLGVVAAGSGLTWLVIQRVGHVVSSQGPVADVPAVGPVGTVAPSASVAPAPSRPSPVGPRTARASTGVPTPRAATPRPTPRPTGVTASAAPGSRAASPRPPAPRPTRRASPAPAPAPPPSSQPRPATVTRAWTGTGGRISVSCTGPRAALVSASPADGWQVEVGDRGPEEVEATFGSSGSEVQVKARCSGGEPRFEVERTSDG